MSTKPLVPGKFYYLPKVSIFEIRDGIIDLINLGANSSGDRRKVFFVGLHHVKFHDTQLQAATCLVGERVINLVMSVHSGFSQYGMMLHSNYGPPPLIPAEDIDGECDET
ncbi:MAG: hypothetical protein E6R04_01375 [Spirochaetes bacterium]|nr:MAG: hypothetical protein E6R04_01375 [Spirochaetota bacterium]